MAKKKNGAATASAEPTSAEETLASEDEVEATAQINLAAETLTGDVRDFILDRLHHELDKRPWTERSENEQRRTVSDVEVCARHLVRRAVEVISAKGNRVIKATIESVTVKEGIKAVLTMSKFDEHRHNLIDATGSAILIVVADPEEFTGERAPVTIKPDQPELLGEAAMVVHSEADGAEMH